MAISFTADEDRVRAVVAGEPRIGLAILFGSTVSGAARQDSDLDLAVAGRHALSAAEKLDLVERLAVASGRTVDLIDLLSAAPPLLRRVLTTGKVCHKTDFALYADVLRKMWYDQADIMPNYDMVLEKRRRRFVGG